ncbi:hypothetical protein [Spirosoma sp. KUDC1026]|uniref:hypothetical protein n=1 Tax=Spirosoma sp. KUDC1026 TaxID=2745947 RepID=UPI00159B8EA8|nr:hypothetical protein [Spirosoma sp. KUDC1026]QKZ15154.1 hypothetical protein HU175_22035 [Spirosoma sp. KUDC1026]
MNATTSTSHIDLTELEEKVLRNIVGSEYQDCDPTDYAYMTTHEIYSFSATNESKSLRGALGSCIKKGLAGAGEPYEGEPTCFITEHGLRALSLI